MSTLSLLVLPTTSQNNVTMITTHGATDVRPPVLLTSAGYVRTTRTGCLSARRCAGTVWWMSTLSLLVLPTTSQNDVTMVTTHGATDVRAPVLLRAAGCVRTTRTGCLSARGCAGTVWWMSTLALLVLPTTSQNNVTMVTTHGATDV